MTTALIVFLNVFFVAFVLVTVAGLLAWSIVSDRTTTASIADQWARLRTALQRQTAPARRRPQHAHAAAGGQPRQGLGLGA